MGIVNYRLKALIIEHYGSQVDFAEELGQREETISRVVRGRQTLPDKEKQRWAQMLGATPEALFPDAQ